MGIQFNPEIPTGNLVSCFDTQNPKSYSHNAVPFPVDLFRWCGTASLNTCSISRDDSINRSPAGGIPLKMFSQGTDSYIATYNSSLWNLSRAAPGQTWTLSFWAKASSTATAEPYLFSANGSGNYIEAPSSLFTVTTFWQRFSFSATFSNASTFYVQARLGCRTSGVNIWFDGLQVERISPARDFNPIANANLSAWYDLCNPTVPIELNETVAPVGVSSIRLLLISQPGTNPGTLSPASRLGTLGTGNWSISIWWRSNNTTQNNFSALLSQGFTGSPVNGAWALKVSHTSNNYNFTYVGTSGTIFDNLSGVNVNDELWHHLVVVRNGTSLALYRDAQDVLFITLPSNFNFGADGSPVLIGANTRDSAIINGYISNITVYNTNITTSQIQTIYNNFISRYYSQVGGILYKTPGTYTFTVPQGVYAVTVLCIGGGGASSQGNGFTDTTGQSGGNSSFGSTLTATGGSGGQPSAAGAGGSGTGIAGSIGGGNGGNGGGGGSGNGGGGGAGGYSGNGGAGGSTGVGSAGSGGGGGGGGSWSGTTPDGSFGDGGAGGGGVGVYGQGTNGTAGGNTFNTAGGGGGSDGAIGVTGTGGSFPWNGSNGGLYGGGGGSNQYSNTGGGGGGGLRYYNNVPVFPGNQYLITVGGGGAGANGGSGGGGAVRVIWGLGRSFPSTNVGPLGGEQVI